VGCGNGIGINERDRDGELWVSAANEYTGAVGTVHVHPGIKALKPGVIAAERTPAASTK
jgi:hypothetical protein